MLLVILFYLSITWFKRNARDASCHLLDKLTWLVYRGGWMCIVLPVVSLAPLLLYLK
jgi:hypothetical protein